MVLLRLSGVSLLLKRDEVEGYINPRLPTDSLEHQDTPEPFPYTIVVGTCLRHVLPPCEGLRPCNHYLSRGDDVLFQRFGNGL
jgi:hypothetical protein